MNFECKYCEAFLEDIVEVREVREVDDQTIFSSAYVSRNAHSPLSSDTIQVGRVEMAKETLVERRCSSHLCGLTYTIYPDYIPS